MADNRLLIYGLIVTGILVLLILFLVLRTREPQKRETDYRVFFILGIVWFPLGIAMDNSVFFILGLVYMVIGLANRDKWAKKEKREP